MCDRLERKENKKKNAKKQKTQCNDRCDTHIWDVRKTASEWERETERHSKIQTTFFYYLEITRCDVCSLFGQGFHQYLHSHSCVQRNCDKTSSVYLSGVAACEWTENERACDDVHAFFEHLINRWRTIHKDKHMDTFNTPLATAQIHSNTHLGQPIRFDVLLIQLKWIWNLMRSWMPLWFDATPIIFETENNLIKMFKTK